jgi:MarR family transcriptional regulator for hemolysin
MSTTKVASPSVPFGRHLGAAVRSGRNLLDIVLIGEAMTYDTWIALNLISSGAGNGMPRDDLERDLRQGLPGANEASVAQLLAQLARHGLVQTLESGTDKVEPRVVLTAEGEVEFHRVLAVVNAASAQALSGIAPEDVATTIRVLGQFQQGAAAATL